MLQFLKKYDKPISISVLIGSVILSIGILFIPLDPDDLVAYGYGGVFLITMLGAATLFIPGPTMVATFVIGSLLNPLIVALVAGLGSAIGESTGYAAGYASRSLITAKERKNTWYVRIKYSYFKFLLASFLGKSIRFGISAYLGFGLGHFISSRQ